MGPTTWFALVAFGFFLIRFVIPRVGNKTVKAISVRVAALSFLGAGLITASGWIGNIEDQGIRLANKQGADLTAAIVGAAVIWIIWLLLALMMLLTFLPESWFGGDIPDWLSISGVFLPSLMSYVPGSIGEFMRRLMEAGGGVLIDLVRGALS